ncbi:MAG: ComF family protein [Bacteroidetes bacterium]|nr:ComF family protein [Bacteroidota bacterium]
MGVLANWAEAAACLFFPHHCAGCGTDRLDKQTEICLRCLHRLPLTHFTAQPDNPVEKIFWGRTHVQAATSLFFYSQDSTMQSLLHELKYRGNQALGIQLGSLLGTALKNTSRFPVDVLVPVPLHPSKEKSRGFNQATLICQGIAAVTGLPVCTTLLRRNAQRSTQTKKDRAARWENMQGIFEATPFNEVPYKNILLIDDVITTGATLEACGQALLEAEERKLWIASVCYSNR